VLTLDTKTNQILTITAEYGPAGRTGPGSRRDSACWRSAAWRSSLDARPSPADDPALFPDTCDRQVLIAAATSGTAQVQLMELWADGKKVAQTDGTPFDEPVSLDAGTHTLTLVEQDATGTEIKSAPFQVAVVGNDHPLCSAPSKPGVNVCSPYPGDGCNTQPWVDFDAVGKGKSGTVNRMELWISGTKIANFPGDRISTSLIMVFGEVSIVEVDSKGDSISSSFPFYGPC
jgi:hypothetical protein